MKIYNVALIGCGKIGAVHLEHIYFKENISVKCVCDTDLKKAELFKRKYGAEFAETEPLNCIDRPDVDIVIIATYPSTHTRLIELCFKHGKHVICEKPVAVNKEDEKKFYSLVSKYPNCKFLAGYILRHNETYKKVAGMIREGCIGRPIVMRMVQNHHTMNWERYLKLIKETSPLIDCGVHYMDVMQWFTGEKIESVSAIGARTEPDVPKDKYNYGLCTVKLSGGSIGYYEAGWTNSISASDVKEFIGPKGRIKIIYKDNRTSNAEEGDLIEYYKYPEKEYITINLNDERKPTDLQIDYLINMIENDTPPVPSIDEICESLNAVFEADRQIREGII